MHRWPSSLYWLQPRSIHFDTHRSNGRIAMTDDTLVPIANAVRMSRTTSRIFGLPVRFTFTPPYHSLTQKDHATHGTPDGTTDTYFTMSECVVRAPLAPQCPRTNLRLGRRLTHPPGVPHSRLCTSFLIVGSAPWRHIISLAIVAKTPQAKTVVNNHISVGRDGTGLLPVKPR
jgi:hypothetical protein